MAKTYDAIPYAHQVLGNILSNCAIARNEMSWNHLWNKCGNRVMPNWTYAHHGAIFGLTGMDSDFIIELTEAESTLTGMDPRLSFNRVAYAMHSGKFDILKSVTVAKNISLWISWHHDTKFYTDEDARFKLLIAFLTNQVGYREVHKIDSPAARAALHEVILQQLPGSGLSARTLLEALKVITLPGANDLYDIHVAADAAEVPLTSTGRQKHHDTICRTTSEAVSWAKIDANSLAAKASSSMKISRLLNLWACCLILDGEKCCLLLDRTSLEQVRQCVRFFSGLQFYCFNYRISGRGDRSYDHRQTFYTLLDWIVNSLRYCENKRINYAIVARHCKICIGALTTIVFNAHDIAELGAERRYQELYEEAKSLLPDNDCLIDVLKECDLAEDELIDFAYIFHGLPTADFVPKELLEKTLTDMNNPLTHSFNETAFEEFMNYAKAFHASHIAYVHRGDVNLATTEGYDPQNEQWFKRCSRGQYSMPPKEDWGKCWVQNHYEYRELIEYWFIDAGDTTHVNQDLESELCIQARGYEGRLEANELTYLFLHGEKLSRKYNPSDVRKLILSGQLPKFCLSMLSAKAENTKFGTKTRDIHAADDISREAMTEVDRNTNRIAADIAGPVLRMPAPVLNGLLMSTSKQLVQNGQCVATSQDVSSWSVNLPRPIMFTFSEYLINMCKGEDKLSLKNIWKNLTLGINRRGFSGSGKAIEGCVMGWSGCNDTILHATLVSYCINIAKEAGILYQSESATSFELIDDSVLCLNIKGDLESAVPRLSKFLDIMIDTYASLGFAIDRTKTIISRIKMTFLNRIFTRGVELPTAAKVAAKVDRELTRRFSSVLEQIQSLFTSSASATARGADPIAYYIYSIHRALMIINRVVDLSEYNSSNIAFVARAPQSLGDWGFPSIISFLTVGRSDVLSGFIHDEVESIQVFRSTIPEHAKYISNRLQTVMYRGFKEPDTMNFLQNPTAVTLDGPVNPAFTAKKEFRKAAFRAAKAPFIKSILDENTERTLSNAVNSLLRAGCHDAAFIETIYNALPQTLFKV